VTFNEIRQSYIDDGFDIDNATTRTAQDVVLELISSSPLAKNVTIKGGVVMQELSKDSRRATQDIDFDFIRFSIADESIRRFIKLLNSNKNGIAIAVLGDIEVLKHKDYSGKRVHAELRDQTGISIQTKLDIGVHKDLDLVQAPLYFDLSKIGEGVTLLANNKEQIVAEKLKSLLRVGAASTRFKDVFDIYYLVVEEGLDDRALLAVFEVLIFSDVTMHEQSMNDVCARLNDVFHNRRFVSSLENAKHNWLQLPPKVVVDGILDYCNNLTP